MMFSSRFNRRGGDCWVTNEGFAMKDSDEKEWLHWKSLVAVSAMPAACGFMFWAGRLTVDFHLGFDAIFQGICTLAGAATAAGFISYQVRKTFANDRELRRLDRLHDRREKLLLMWSRVVKKRLSAAHVLNVLSSTDFKARQFGLTMNYYEFRALTDGALDGFGDIIVQSEQFDYLRNFEGLVSALENVPSMVAGLDDSLPDDFQEFNRNELRELMVHIIDLSERLIGDFATTFPPE
jgi:hypothetical protein